MNEFNLSEYGIFTTAIQTTNSRKTSLESDCSAIETNMNSLNDSDIFMGRACDSIVSGWKTIKTNLENTIRELDKTSLTLKTMQSNYQSSDAANEEEIGGVIYNGK